MMIAALPRGAPATIVSLVCLAGAVGAGVVTWVMSGRWDVLAAAAAISGLTGVLAALAMVLLPRSRRSAGAVMSSGSMSSRSMSSGPTSPAMRPQPDLRRPVERRSPAGGRASQPPMPIPVPAQPLPGSRHAAASPMTPVVRQSTPTPAPGDPRLSPADPRAAAPLAEHRALLPEYRALLAQRATLLRGLAELVARLPEEFAWQAAKLLEESGARKVVPELGAVFDPVLHSVFGTEPTLDAGGNDTVAYTLRAGWVDRDQVLVTANVVLYALREQAECEPDHDQQ